MIDPDMEITYLEMAEMVNDELLCAIEQTVIEISAERKITITQVELTLAAMLATELSNSCETQEEVRVNCKAYFGFVLDFALSTLSSSVKQTRQ